MATDAQRRFYAIRAALQPAEKALIAFYELNWHMLHSVPTVQEVYEHLKRTRPNLKLTTVNYYLGRQPVIKALKDRGIPFEQHTQSELTEAQMAAAITVMNMMDNRSINDKLDELGIKPATYYAWLNDPQFKNFLDSKADQNKINIRPHAVAEFTKKINQGDMTAIKFWMEATGELENKNQSQSEHLLMAIIEIIQKHVKDPAVMVAIALDIKNAANNRTLEVINHPQITGEVVEDDPEVEKARRMLMT
jgi:hypothetical protein